MTKFKVEVGYAFMMQNEKYAEQIIEAVDELDLVKKLREQYSGFCYDDKDLVEWVESSENWGRQVDDALLLELISYDDDGIMNIALAEDMYFEAVEI